MTPLEQELPGDDELIYTSPPTWLPLRDIETDISASESEQTAEEETDDGSFEEEEEETHISTSEEIKAEAQRQAQLTIEQMREDIRRSVQGEFDRKYGASVSDLEELKKLRSEKRRRDREAAEAQGDYEKALASVREEHIKEKQQLREDYDNLLDELRNTRINGQILAAASQRAINPEHVAQLLRHQVKLDNETFDVSVIDERGERMFRDGRPLTVTELVQDFLGENPHMAVPSGAGRSAGAGGSNADGGDADSAESAELRALEEEVRAAQARAAKTRNQADIVEAHRLKRELGKKRRAAATA